MLLNSDCKEFVRDFESGRVAEQAKNTRLSAFKIPYFKRAFR